MTKARSHFPPLSELARRIAITDGALIEVLAKRQDISLKVGQFKDIHNQRKIRRPIERKRTSSAAKHAKRLGVDGDFARAIIQSAIAESCKVQIEQTDSKLTAKELRWLESPDPKRWRTHLRESLLKLTRVVAHKYETDLYGKTSSVATQMYTKYEWAQIYHQISILKAQGNLHTALDLGCATGRLSRPLAEHFKRVIGCDISPDLLEIARKTTHQNLGSVEYLELDIEKGLEGIPSQSVNLVAMSVGTGSDIEDLRCVLASIHRVLTTKGRFVLSFYNKSALMYHSFLPWTLSLNAHVNVDKRYMEVRVGKKMFPIFAQLYDPTQIKHLIERAGLKVSETSTYPTIGSILPDSVLKQRETQKPQAGILPKDLPPGEMLFAKSVAMIDQSLASKKLGAYIIVVGGKED